jgi:hypothetical protein
MLRVLLPFRWSFLKLDPLIVIHNVLLCGNFDLSRSFERPNFFINYNISAEAQLISVNIHKSIGLMIVLVPSDH